jgi:lipid II:glycine glycyltransferase (peptidoglycan interpeptide bridge formation enzyme)
LNFKISEFIGDLDKWDNFVMKCSINGTFLHTRNFLNYHSENDFKDCSIIITQNDDIVAVVPACEELEHGKKVFYSHKGSTFGGIILSERYNKISSVNEIIIKLEEYLRNKNFNKIIYKNTSEIFCKDKNVLLNYFLFKNDYYSYDELSFYINLMEYKDNIEANFSSKKRRDFRISQRCNLSFKEIVDEDEIKKFYNILSKNLLKFNTSPTHTFEELLELKKKRIKDIVRFYGVFYENKIIAGSMTFNFNERCLHTQYLATDYDYKELYAMDFLDYNLIKLAKEKGFQYFSFGISTEEHGKKLNFGLAKFKEGFGTKFLINKTYYKLI